MSSDLPQTQMIALRVTVRAPDLEAFIDKYSKHIAGDRIFIFTKNPQKPGTRLRFTLQLASGERLIEGRGTVMRVQPDSGDKRRPPGIELKFVALDDRSQTLVDFMRTMRTMRAEEPPLVRAVRADAGAQPPPLPPPPDGPVAATPSPAVVAAARAPRAARAAPSLVAAAPMAPVTAVAPAPMAPIPSGAPSPALPSPLPAERVPPRPFVVPRGAASAAADAPATTPATAAAPPTPAAAATAAAATAAAPASAAALVPPRAANHSSSSPPEVFGPPEVLAPPAPSVAAERLEPGPPPVFAEKWSDALQAGAPAAGTDDSVPANPFSEVSDGAIEYFVEWSLEQSIGPRADKTSTFSDISMTLPGVAERDAAPDDDELAPATRRSRAALPLFGVATFAAGLAVGVVATRMAQPPSRPLTTRSLMVAEPLLASARIATPPAPAPEPPSAPPSAERHDAELSVVTVPAGAEVSIDGDRAGVSPFTMHVAPGKHEVTVARDRYESATKMVVAPGSANIFLKRPGAVLRIESTPPGAEVTIGSVPRGATPIESHLAAFESYDVTVTRTGAPAWRRTIYLRSPKQTVKATLPPATKPAAGRSVRPGRP